MFMLNRSRSAIVISAWLGVVMAGWMSVNAQAQVATARQEGLRENNPRWHAIVGARLVSAPGKTMENATIVMRDGVIVSIAANTPAPAGARVWKLEGRTVYAGMIDLSSSLGVPAQLLPVPVSFGARVATSTPRPLNGRGLASDNVRVRPEQDVASQLELRADEVKAVRELGFTHVLATPAAGLFRGQSALLKLATGDQAKTLVVKSKVAQHIAHELDPMSRGSYPGSLMGVIAQIRQSLYDAQWYQRALQSPNKQQTPQLNDSLEALEPVLAGKQSVVYVADNEQAYQRIQKIRDEFKLKVILHGNGYEYRRLSHLKAAAMPLIVPLVYPNAPEVEHPDLRLDTSLEAMQHWEQAPSNLAMMNQAGLEFAVTAAGLKDAKKDFWPRLRLAVRRGLSAEVALAALTTTPAKLLGEQARLGQVRVGAAANLVVASGDLFSDDQAQIEMSFIDGQAIATEHYRADEIRGTWEVKQGGQSSVWVIAGAAAKPSLTVDGQKQELNLKDAQFVVRVGDAQVVAQLQGDQLLGSVQDAQGRVQTWLAKRVKPFVAEKSVVKPEVMPPTWSATSYPAGPYSRTKPEQAKQVLIKNATIWTSAAAGKLVQSDMWIADGKIKAIGQQLAVPAGAEVIDASGKHISPGIIDAHSHLAIMQGTNEATSSITAEVRIGDVIDATSINIYRQLAGGLTAANVLHGSANTIGGQNQVIKLRWGEDAEGLKLQDAFPGIKFALGENVKQSNSSQPTGRYPQTRMGVEQILRSAFLEARAYRAEFDQWRKDPKKLVEPRRDLQMETLLELLDRKRMIHIHSYRQDEILMFVRLAKEFNLLVGTFQHVMEGYKVANEIASIGAGGSTFSDWWGYKMEVSDSVPFNGALMHQAGVLTTFNSDSDELARHLTTEAAKAVKYGDLSETDALRFVTINAAKQLKIDHKTGSLEVGKEADFVIWNTSPLSTYSKAEQTWIEGRRYFDLADDARLRAQAQAERQRLMSKIIASKSPVTSGANSAMKPNGERQDKDKQVSTPKTAAEQLAANQAYLALQQWLHMMSRHQTGYWAGEFHHECTEE